VRLTYVGHATVLLELGGRRILTDPLLRSRLLHLRRVGARVDPAIAEGLDAILISHAHLDHLDARSLRRLPVGVPLVVPAGAARLARRVGRGPVTELAAGEAVEVGSVTVRAVPAAHPGRRHPLGFHAEAIGYVFERGRRVYFAGDTGLFDGMRDLADGIDVALLPVWGWGPTLGPGHLDPREAAQALTLLRPRVAIPIHWGTLFPWGLERIRGDALWRPPRAFKREAARVAPEVDVRIVEPGGSLDLELP
jgi:L-ascorbate metabolism protein UlaG (beta-lactamase superfamily)